jgi:hypothetical protein
MHPNLKIVLPLSIEPIIKQDGQTKNDCEENSCKRLLKRIKLAHPKLKLIIVLDGLYATAPIVKLITELNWHYIIVAKDTQYLFNQFINKSCEKATIVSPKTGKTTQVECFYQSNLILNKSNQDVTVNVLEYKETTEGKSRNYHNIWITDIALNKNTVNAVARGGRCRWHIENETFNTLKNQGYCFEHNFGHGYKNLSTVMAYLMFTAFLIDQVQELTSKAFQKVLAKLKRRLYLWDRFRSLFITVFFDSWQQLYDLAENENNKYNAGLSFTAISNSVAHGPPAVNCN